MNWIFVGMLAGSLITSTHTDKEACEGRKTTMSEHKVNGKCVELPTLVTSGSVFSTTISPYGR